MTGKWQDASGIETYHYHTSKNGKRLAEILHRNVLKGTPLRNRGVKTANFHVLHETNMPAVLLELGFMDNLVEAQLLLTNTYRYEVR